jgi:DNA polymerase V
MISAGTHTGFPSPADDYLELVIDLNKEVIQNPTSTFYAKVKGVSMVDALIYPNDIIVIDKSLRPQNNDIVVCIVNGAFEMRRIRINKGGVWITSNFSTEKPILITSQTEFTIWGVVTNVFKTLRQKP